MQIVAMQEGVVDFGRYPDAALQEVAAKQLVNSADRVIIISKLRTRLLNINGAALLQVLQDLHEAAMRHGADDDVVVLTAPMIR
jgi:hypothetical protein